MGCYGIGINRILAAAVEAGHDANGIIWPLPLAPYQVVLVPLQVHERGRDGSRPRLEPRSSRPPGVDVLIDDRDQRPGVKFKDADLIGIPVRVVIGERGLKDGTSRSSGGPTRHAHTVPAEDAADGDSRRIDHEERRARTIAADRTRREARREGEDGMSDGPSSGGISPSFRSSC